MSDYEDEPRLVVDLDRQSDEYDCNNNKTNNVTSLSVFKEIYNRCKKSVNVEVCFKIEELIRSNKLKLEDLDDFLIEKLKLIDENSLFVFDLYESEQEKSLNNQSHRFNSQNLTLFIRNWYASNKQLNKKTSENQNHHKNDSNSLTLKVTESHCKMNGYKNEKNCFYNGKPNSGDTNQNNFSTQNKFECNNSKFNFELYVSRIKPQMNLNALKKLFENYGRLNHFTINNDQITGQIRSYAFVGFSNYFQGNNALKELSDYEFIPGQKIGVFLSETQAKRIYINSIPKNLKSLQIKNTFSKHLEGLKLVHVYPPDTADPKSKGMDRCYLEFESKQLAISARTKLTREKINHIFLTIDLVDIQSTSTIAKTTLDETKNNLNSYSDQRKLYVRNLGSTTSEKDIFDHFIRFGRLAGIVKKSDYAFVEFSNQQDALTAMQQTHLSDFKNNKIRVTLARNDKSSVEPLKQINEYQIEPMYQSTPSKRKIDPSYDKNSNQDFKRKKYQKNFDKENSVDYKSKITDDLCWD